MKKILKAALAQMAAQNIMLHEIRNRALLPRAYDKQLADIGKNFDALAALVEALPDEADAPASTATPPAP